MSIANFAVADAPVADSARPASGIKKPGPRRISVARADLDMAPESR